MCTNWLASNYGHGESSGHGETETWSDSTGITHSKSVSMGTSIESASSSLNMRHVTEDLERRVRLLAKHLPVAEFVRVRIRLEDLFDSILLAGLR